MSELTVIGGLTDLAGNGDGTRPDVSVLARISGANVIRLSFRAGQVMSDHRAARPILVIGQVGEVEFTTDESSTLLRSGVAVGVDADVTHALSARTDAVVTLVVLEKPAN